MNTSRDSWATCKYYSSKEDGRFSSRATVVRSHTQQTSANKVGWGRRKRRKVCIRREEGRIKGGCGTPAGSTERIIAQLVLHFLVTDAAGDGGWLVGW